jgi:hypothetical protein
LQQFDAVFATSKELAVQLRIESNFFGLRLAGNPRCRALAASPSYDFVPMVQHCSPIDCSQLYNAAASISPQANKILAMNEPNEKADACKDPKSKACKKKCLPSVAAEKWPVFEKLANSTSPARLLGTPAPGGLKAIGTKDYPVPWLQEWVGNCTRLYGPRGCYFDFVAVHFYECYGNSTEQAEKSSDNMMQFLDSVHELFNKPIWLTEFNCGDSTGPTANQPAANHLRFMKVALPKLEASPYVERYSWFYDEPSRSPSLTAVDPTTGEFSLTELAKFYNEF